MSARGRQDAAAAGRWLLEHDLIPDRVLCSSAARTRETWQRAVLAGGTLLAAARVDELDAIYQAEPDRLLRLVHGLPETTRTAVLVGHTPGLPALTDLLWPRSAGRPLDEFPTSTVVAFASTAAWSATDADAVRLVAHAVPRG